ncbi:hypothetical protein NC653_038860 [Populus alba x Populus x berolinensis]|uniref:Uncharacterized protein n=1 Tax=Populus alba x Populus x berolinensis TaxID=444605 RepID=A0AAD6PUS5_9ROSI|nr:hypothetical protein NC653_038860 [Populus alba x Populus x berolinensis]
MKTMKSLMQARIQRTLSPIWRDPQFTLAKSISLLILNLGNLSAL